MQHYFGIVISLVPYGTIGFPRSKVGTVISFVPCSTFGKVLLNLPSSEKGRVEIYFLSQKERERERKEDKQKK